VGAVHLILVFAAIFLHGCARVPVRPSPKSAAPTPAPTAVEAVGRSGVRPSTRRVTDPKAGESEATIERRAAAHAAFAAAMIQQDEDGTSGALDLFRKSLADDPDNLSLAVDLARRLLERKDRDAALEILRRSAPRSAGSEFAGTIQSLLAVTLAQLGKKDEAMTAYREAIRLSPAQLVNYRALAELQAAAGRRPEVLTTLEQAAAAVVTEPGYWVDLAELFRQHAVRDTNAAPRSIAAARSALEKAAGLKPEDPGLLQRMGERYEAVGLPEKAEAIYQGLRTRFPRDPRPTAKLAELYLRMGKNKEAGEQLEALKRENPSNPVPFYYLGLLAYEAKDFPRAVSHFERAVLLNPDFEPIYADLAAARLSLGKPEEALVTLDKAALQFKPEFRREYLAALANSRLLRFDAAMARFLAAEAAAREKQPELLDHQFYFQIGAMLEKAGKEERSIEYLQKSLKLKPEFDEALNHLGYMWADKGVRLEEAHDMIRRAVKAEPDNPAYLDSLGWVLFRLGRAKEAVEPLQKAVRLLTEPDATVLDHLGDVLSAVGRKAEAREVWVQSEKIEKSDAVRRKIDAAK
jgi:tetratricopeptide (TPR) repeat protein